MQPIINGLQTPVLGNPVSKYLLAVLLYLALILGLKILQRIVIQKIKTLADGSAHKKAGFLIGIFEKTVISLLYFAAFYFAVTQLSLDPALARILRTIWIVVLSFQSIKFAIAVLVYLIEEVWAKKHTKDGGAFAIKSILTILRLGIWSIGVIFVLDNLGFNVSAIVAGLGITGIAVALAAQTILGDLFNYFVIFFDRPFEEGDFVVFDNYMGAIENIGVKSTRIRSLDGEQIVISNSSLTSSKIRNYKRMAERRVQFKVGVTYETPLEKLKKIPETLRRIIESQQGIRIDRAHFKEFGAYSLDFEIVYYVLGPDYNQYMDIQQNINLAIMEAFKKEGIEFAYPTTIAYQKPLGQS